MSAEKIDEHHLHSDDRDGAISEETIVRQNTYNNGNGTYRPSGSTADTYLNNKMDRDEALTRIRTAGSIAISPELFEKLYLSPENKVKGELRRTFGNPTPLALVGFILSLTPLSMDLMGWRGAGGGGAASIGGYYFLGGLCMFVGGVLEFFLGNTFPFVVFTCFGGYWFAYGATLTPAFAAAASYATATQTNGAAVPAFNATFGFYLLAWTLLVFVFLVASLRTNVVFFLIFLSLDLAFGLLTGGYMALAMGKAGHAGTLIKGGGACAFVTSMCGWYIFIVQILASVDFPLSLPVGDLSTHFPGASSRKTRSGEQPEITGEA